MAMTAAVKDELSRVVVTAPSCRKAEVSAMLRFAGGLHIVAGRIVVEAELDTGSVARRLRRDIAEIYGHTSDISVVAPGGLRRGSRYVVRVVKDGEALARQTGLLDARGRPVRGLPPQVVSGSLADVEAAWRGAFLAHGSLTEPGRSSSLEITCPGPEAALALVGAARRMGIPSKAREVRGVDRVVVRDGDAISALLTRLGAHESVLAWEERRMRREVRATANRLANFDDANLRRSARAAVAASSRVQRALEILGDDVPDHLPAAGQLRLDHGQASLEELGALRRPADDQGRGRRPDPPTAGHGGQARRGARDPQHRGQPDLPRCSRADRRARRPVPGRPPEAPHGPSDRIVSNANNGRRVAPCGRPTHEGTLSDRTRRHQRLRPHRPQLLPRRAGLRRRHRDRRGQRPHRQQDPGPSAQVRLDPRSARTATSRTPTTRSASTAPRSRRSPSATRRR